MATRLSAVHSATVSYIVNIPSLATRFAHCSEGAIELTVFNPLERPATRPAAVVVPCGFTDGKTGSWLAVYGDEEGKGGPGEPPPELLKSQVFPMFIPGGDGRGMSLRGVADGQEKAGVCKLVVAVTLPGLASRKVVVFWNEFEPKAVPDGRQTQAAAEERGMGGKEDGELKLLREVSSNILTADDLLKSIQRGKKQAFNISPDGDLAAAGDKVQFRVEYDATSKAGYAVKVSAESDDVGGSAQGLEMEVRQYVSFPHLNTASGVTPAGVYVMKWSGFALRHIW